jgi:hypothetical protein
MFGLQLDWATQMQFRQASVIEPGGDVGANVVVPTVPDGVVGKVLLLPVPPQLLSAAVFK